MSKLRKTKPGSNQNDKLKKVVKEALTEVLLDNDALVEIINSVTNHALQKQAALLKEAIEIIDERLDEMNESVDRKLEKQTEMLSESISVGPTGGYVGGNSDEEVHKQFLINELKAKGVPVQDESGYSLRASTGRQSKQHAGSKQQKAASLVKQSLGVDVFADIDVGRVAGNHHIDESEIAQAYGDTTPYTPEDVEQMSGEGASYSISPEEFAQL